MSHFSLSMIVKNGVNILPRILDYAEQIWDSVVIVDTGSTDGTVEFLKEKYPLVRVFTMPWNDDFAAARNFSLRMLSSTTTTFMWLDADDTFDLKTGRQWRRLAKQLMRSKYAAYELPYHYAVDERDNPIIIHYRERIMKNPYLWEWREPIHEVCCYVGDDGAKNAMRDYPVIHRPEPDARDAGRNARIINRAWMEGKEDQRHLYYVQKEALGRGELELSIKVGQQLIDTNVHGYYCVEGYKHLGDAYRRLWERDGVCQNAEKAEAMYRHAIERAPDRNEARDNLIDFLMRRNQAMDALVEVDKLHIKLPHTRDTLLAERYSTEYRAARHAQVFISAFGLTSDAILWHVLSTDCDNPPAQCYDNDVAIRAWMEKEDCGIVSCQPQHALDAKHLADLLCAKGKFKKCFVVPHIGAVNLGRKIHFHLGTREDACYDEASPQVQRVLVAPNTTGLGEPGWSNLVSWPLSKSNFAKEVYDTTYELPLYNAALTIEKALTLAKTQPDDWGVYLLGMLDSVELDRNYPELALKDVPHDKAIIYQNDGKAVYLIGRSSVLARMVAIENTLILDSYASIIKKPLDNEETGVEYAVEVRRDSLGTVAIYAGGTEPWDGITPYCWGIGASESSVVYLAEQLYKMGYAVTVFTTTRQHSIVSGVRYAPATDLPQSGDWDLFISSREPRLLDRRLAKKQLLWMHDIAEKYDLTSATKMDGVVCVSKWQKEQVIEKLGLAAGKIHVIPNILPLPVTYDTHSPKQPLDVVWGSDPCRGLDTLLAWKEEGIAGLADIYVTYGFANHLLAGDRKAAYLETLRTKHRIRKAGAKLIGRVGIVELRGMMQDSGKFIMPSNFPETFCVSALEAYQNGMQCVVSDTGAVLETLDEYAEGLFTEYRNIVVPMPATPGYGGTAKEEKKWKKEIATPVQFWRKSPQVSERVRPEHVAQQWIRHIPKETLPDG